MKPLASRLVLTVVLFVGWLCYLGYQVVTRPRTGGAGPQIAGLLDGMPGFKAGIRPLVVSRPQVMASDLDVIAEAPDNSGTVTVVEVLYPTSSALQPGEKIQVTNLADCAPIPRPDEPKARPDWSGPGRYLLPLRRLPDATKYQVAAIPPSPGFFLQSAIEPPSRIYPDTPETRAQYHEIKKARP